MIHILKAPPSSLYAISFTPARKDGTVIRNLLSYAIKFSHKKGCVKISANSAGKFVEIIVIDSGTGIKKKDIDKLFRIDTNFTMPGTANEKGAGPGLILCKEFVAMNKGAIRVESVIGKDSRFIVSLPKG